MSFSLPSTSGGPAGPAGYGAGAGKVSEANHGEDRGENRSSWKGSHYLSVNFGNPNKALLLNYQLLAPFRWAVWFILPLALVGFLAMFQNSTAMSAELTAALRTTNYWTKLIIGLFVISFGAKWGEGLMMVHYGLDPEEFGIRMLYGIWPRFFIKRLPIMQLDYRKQRNVWLAPAAFRIILFSVCMILWDATRRNGTGFSEIALVLGNAAYLSFLTTANPLWHADGYRIIASHFEAPKLREQAIYVIWRLITFRSLPKDLSSREFWGLIAWGVGSFILTSVFVYTTVSAISWELTVSLSGLGVIIFGIVLVSVFMYIWIAGPRSQVRKHSERERKDFRVRERAKRDHYRRVTTILAARQAERDLQAADPTIVADGRNDEDQSSRGPAQPAGRAESARDSGRTPPGGGPAPGKPPEDPKKPGEDDSSEEKPGDGKDAKKASPSRPEIAGTGDLDDILSMPGPKGADASKGSGPDEVTSLLDSVFADAAFNGEDLAIFDDPDMGFDMNALWDDEPKSADKAEGPQHPPEPPPHAAPETVPGAPRVTPEARETPQSPAPTPSPTPAPTPAGSKPSRRSSRHDPLADLDRVLQMGASTPSKWKTWRKRIFWALVIVGLIWVALLPYPYRVGGDFTVMPLTHTEARARISGEIVQVNVKQGDWVKKGQVLAVLSDWNQTKDVATNVSNGQKLQADLQTMLDGATQQQIAVAKAALATAEVAVTTAKQNLDRQEALYKSKTISQQVLETAQDSYKSAVAQRDTAKAQLDLVSAPTRKTDIEAQKAQIASNDAQIKYSKQMLEFTRIRATSSGQITNDLTQLPVGDHLSVGGLFANIEDNRTAVVSIDVPETSIDGVKKDAKVELRLWSDPLKSVHGKVTSVAPSATQVSYGYVVPVDVQVPNPDGLLRSNMTGYGKIRVADIPVWEAFSQTLIGFFKIDLWSWIP